MPEPLAVIMRFNGDSNDLLARFERIRQSWIEAQDGEYERPSFYAACKTDEGIAMSRLGTPRWHTGRSVRASTLASTPMA